MRCQKCRNIKVLERTFALAFFERVNARTFFLYSIWFDFHICTYTQVNETKNQSGASACVPRTYNLELKPVGVLDNPKDSVHLVTHFVKHALYIYSGLYLSNEVPDYKAKFTAFNSGLILTVYK